MIELLRTPGLSIKHLDEDRRDLIRRFVLRKHVEEGLSLGDLAKLIGNKTSGYTSWLTRQLGIQPRPFEEARLKGIHEKVRKYERKPFDGMDEDRAYLLGLTHGDLSISRPFNGAIRVSTSTTHPTMTHLFKSLFQDYGHVYEHPRYKKDTDTYEWNLSVILDNSFEFLLQEFHDVSTWVSEDDKRIFGYLSGLLDADGTILVTNDKYGQVYIFVDFYNCDRSLLQWIKDRFSETGYFSSLRRNKAPGTVTKKYGIVHRREYLQLSTYGMQRIYDLLFKLHPRHPEKVLRHSIATSTFKGQPYAAIENDIIGLRDLIETQKHDYVSVAQRVYESKHPDRKNPPLKAE